MKLFGIVFILCILFLFGCSGVEGEVSPDISESSSSEAGESSTESFGVNSSALSSNNSTSSNDISSNDETQNSSSSVHVESSENSSGDSSFEVSSAIVSSSSVQELVSSSLVVPVGTGKFFMYPEADTVEISINPADIDFTAKLSDGSYTFPAGEGDYYFGSTEIEALNVWARELAVTAPFDGYAAGKIPWVNVQSHENIAERVYAFITQEQLAYIYILALFGSDPMYSGDDFEVGNVDSGYGVSNGSTFETGLHYTYDYRDPNHADSYLMFTIMSFLMEVKNNEESDALYVGIAQGGYDAHEGLQKVEEMGMAGQNLSDLNVCYFDESKKVVSSETNPLEDDWCRSEVKTEGAVLQDLTQYDLGGSFHGADIPGQTAVNIAGHNFGGGSACPGCHLSGPQDECMPTFYPETIGFNFFIPVNPPGHIRASIYSVKALTFFGVRRYIDGLSGSSSYTGTCGSPIGASENLLEDKVQVDIGGESLVLYHHSMTFVASQMTGGDLSDWWSAGRKTCLLDNCNIEEPPQLVDVGKWYGAFTPNSYHNDISSTVSTMIRRIGTFNWGAGVWWGDAEQYLFIIWLGTSMLENVTLDYFIMANSCENAGVQCGILDGEDCSSCYEHSFRGQIDFQNSCPANGNGIESVYSRVKNDDVETLYGKLKTASNRVGHVMDGM